MQTAKIIIASVLVGLVHTAGVYAQDTNVWAWVPATKLEAFETNVSRIIIKGTTEMGTVTALNGL
ncbi:MAG TPA: hypothetical protein VHI52_17585, partial [Verrucomicrobiae bacterium]|nr:hypothetical protein [Verrucomicrobiae bacterium]